MASRRTREQRLRLFDRVVTKLRSEPAAEFTWTITDVSDPERPPYTDFRSYLMRIRPFDAPKEDVYLPTILEDIRSFEIDPATAKWVDRAEAQYEAAQVQVGGSNIYLNSKLVLPRRCFELLAYTDDLHYDPENEALQEAISGLGWEMLCMRGALYAGQLADTAMVLRSLARDDAATGYLFEPREEGKESAIEWLEAHNS